MNEERISDIPDDETGIGPYEDDDEDFLEALSEQAERLIGGVDFAGGMLLELGEALRSQGFEQAAQSVILCEQLGLWRKEQEAGLGALVNSVNDLVAAVDRFAAELRRR